MTFQEVEAIAIVNMVQSAVEKHKQDHFEDDLPVLWVWESILEKKLYNKWYENA